MNKIATFFNFLLSELALVALVFSWVYLSNQNLTLSIVLCVISFMAFAIVFFLIKNKRSLKISSKTASNKLKANTALKLKIISPKNLIEYFISLLNLNDVICENDLFIQTPTSNFFFNFDSDFLSEDNLCQILKLANFNKDINIYCLNVSEKAKALSERFKVKINFYNIDKIMGLISNANQSLEITEIVEKAKPKPIALLRQMASTQKVKGYFFIAISLLLFSFLSPFKLYYQIFATVLVVFGIVILALKL